MNIICDTNIWYEIGNNQFELGNIPNENNLIAVFNSIDEFTKTSNLVKNEIYTRNAIQAMFKFSDKHAIFEPPLIHLLKLDNPKIKYDIRKMQNFIIEFTEKIANGYKITDTLAFKEYCIERDKNFIDLTEYTNSISNKIKQNIKNIKQHRKTESMPIIRDLISKIVSYQSIKLSEDFDWTKIELLTNTLRVYFTKLETGAIKAVKNDWYDIFILAYVQQSDKIWTKDTKLISLIKEANMEKYLFNN
jgi:hypothetical protein